MKICVFEVLLCILILFLKRLNILLDLLFFRKVLCQEFCEPQILSSIVCFCDFNTFQKLIENYTHAICYRFSVYCIAWYSLIMLQCFKVLLLFKENDNKVSWKAVQLSWSRRFLFYFVFYIIICFYTFNIFFRTNHTRNLLEVVCTSSSFV
jgi:hypothetical protein